MVIHGYLLMGEKKMGKSLGNVLDPNEVIDRFGADALRFYCFREVSFGQDGSVSTAGFEARYEAELANDWGNLASRTLAMIERYRDGVVPEADEDPALAGGEDGLDGLDGEVRALLDDAELTQALEAIWARVRRLNRYVEENRPWDLAKEEGAENQEPDRPRTRSGAGDRLDVVLYNLAEGLRYLALLLLPYMPVTCGRLCEALAEGDRELSAFGARGGGQRIDRIEPLFPKKIEQ
jgi:methionyl-tRNA synthetase